MFVRYSFREAPPERAVASEGEDVRLAAALILLGGEEAGWSAAIKKPHFFIFKLLQLLTTIHDLLK